MDTPSAQLKATVSKVAGIAAAQRAAADEAKAAVAAAHSERTSQPEEVHRAGSGAQ